MLSSASDVWSYGIVMWEIFSGGREPNICKTDIVLKDIAMHIPFGIFKLFYSFRLFLLAMVMSVH
jgi:serine/threonine protein kinase